MFFRHLVLKKLSQLRNGCLGVIFPDGTRSVYGGVYKGIEAEIRILDEAFFRRCVLFGTIGFAESFIADEWESPDLTKVIAWFILNHKDTDADGTRRQQGTGILNILNIIHRFYHKRSPDRLESNPKNHRNHGEPGVDFFKLWLDPTLTFSCGYFDAPETSLEAAQVRKYDLLCRKLHLSEADEVLELGSSWGGFAIHAARHYRCKITTVTHSEKYFAEASSRIQEAGLDDRVEILLADYRSIRGRFDKIVSIEMLDSVGDRHVNGFFEKIHELLKPHGLLALQTVLCPDRQYPILRDGVDFVQKHISPDSRHMCNARITEAVLASGDLNLLDYEDLTPHYARTLEIWRENFEFSPNAIHAQGFDEAFIRRWKYYFCLREACFGTRHLAVAQLIYSRPNNVRIVSPVYGFPTAEHRAHVG